VFREFPYLYDGSLAYEREYMRSFAASPRSTLVIARDGEAVVGAATATPLLEHGEADVAAQALRTVGFDPAQVYYFGESVLLQAYRGRRIGHAFFDHREAAAREHGFAVASFCAVDRPRDHTSRPSDYVPHDVFWSKRGYRRHPGAVATFTWRDLGDAEESAKPMVFWTKELGA
ncbi:MAG TPA: GNAT family N-acetyltransferase, partial [Polyangiales bacterium]|nr:GNAT family N-acetyltransferase [Polyangiales bacterium]